MTSKVVLFSGAMVDADDRPEPRFPPSQEAAVERALGRVLDRLGLGPEDRAVSGAANGGDLIFLERCLERRVRCQVVLPFEQTVFVENSVRPAGDGWVARFERMLAEDGVEVVPLAGDVSDPYASANDEMLARAGPDDLHLVLLWDGEAGDGAGGTAHMYEIARGQASWLVRIDPLEVA